MADEFELMHKPPAQPVTGAGRKPQLIKRHVLGGVRILVLCLVCVKYFPTNPAVWIASEIRAMSHFISMKQNK